ncbi:MAG TPA: glycosyltransferase [Mycobacteriales bacterium]|nr:glycosyltransferase [Mycobacteriales bacterium]
MTTVMKVAHYIDRWLDLSAGFVAAHVRNSRHRSVVISRQGWWHLEAYDLRPRYTLCHLRDRVPDRYKYAALRAQLGPLLALTRSELLHVHFGYAAPDVLDSVGSRPYVLSLHGQDVTGLVTEKPGYYDRVVGRVDAAIVPSRFLAAAAKAVGFTDEQIRVIPSGVDTEFFSPAPLPDGPPTVTYVGRLVEKKGLDVLLAAWPEVLADVPDARLRVLGDGDLAPLLADPPPSVTHLRPQVARRHDQVRDELRRASVVVTPSRTGRTGDAESLLLVNLEAGATGRPVVSTRHGGIPEYVEDGRTGLLVPEADPSALAAALIRLLRDRDLASRLGAAAIDHVAQWDVRRCTARVDALYEELPRRR